MCLTREHGGGNVENTSIQMGRHGQSSFNQHQPKSLVHISFLILLTLIAIGVDLFLALRAAHFFSNKVIFCLYLAPICFLTVLLAVLWSGLMINNP